jgi:hypothetical protein
MGFDPNRPMLRHAHFYIKGGELPFAASAKSKGQRDESGHPYKTVQSSDFLFCEKQ